MRKTLLALAALLTASVAHADPFFVHGLGLGQTPPPLCQVIAGPCVAGRIGPVGNLDAYILAGLAPTGSAGDTSAIIAVDKAGKIRVVLSDSGPASDELDHAGETIAYLYGPATVVGDRFVEWQGKDSVLGVTHRSDFVNVAYTFDDAYAPAALDLLNLMYPKQ
ncbi:hypothetical protein MJ547_04625, partial [Burkholderia gladioli]